MRSSLHSRAGGAKFLEIYWGFCILSLLSLHLYMKKLSPLVIVLVVVVLIGGWLMTGYNGLVTANESVTTAWSQVETQYQRRFDLIPNLEATVRGAANFEQETFTQVTAARSQWQGAGTQAEKIAAAGAFDSALSRLLVTVENYPQLQATQAFRDFMTQLEGTENRISTARRDYNEIVQGYNVRVKRFPGNILAGVFGFDEKPFFESAEGSDIAPTVNFE